MLYNGVGQWLPTRLAPEASHRFALSGGSVASSAVLVTERADNARLEGLGCAGDRRCAPCAAKAKAQRDQDLRIEGFGSFGVDEDIEAKAVAVGFLENALPRLEALSIRLREIPPPTLLEAHLSSTYFDQFAPLQEEATKILNAIPLEIPASARATIVASAEAFQRTLLDIQGSRSYAPQAIQIATGTLPGVSALYFAFKDEVDREASLLEYETETAAVATLETIKKKVQEGRDALAGAFGWGQVALALAAGALLLGLYGRARG